MFIKCKHITEKKQDLTQDTSVKNYMDTFFFCHVGKDKLCENMVTEHTLVSWVRS